MLDLNLQIANDRHCDHLQEPRSEHEMQNSAEVRKQPHVPALRTNDVSINMSFLFSSSFDASPV